METVLSNVVKEGKGLKGRTFGNANRKDADVPTSAAEHLLTRGELGVVAVPEDKKNPLSTRIYLILTYL